MLSTVHATDFTDRSQSSVGVSLFAELVSAVAHGTDTLDGGVVPILQTNSDDANTEWSSCFVTGTS